MSFALTVFRGDADLAKCPFIDGDTAHKITDNLTSSDWREEHVESLAREVSGMDLRKIAGDIGAEIIDGGLKLRCLGSDYFVSPLGEVTSQRHMNVWIKILLLHYIRTAGSAPFKDEWISFSELRGGMVKASSFTRDCEAPLKEIVDRNVPLFERVIGSLGGKAFSGRSADHEWIIYPLPRVPFRIHYWRSNSEFDSALKILFDKSADDYLDVESYIFLGEGLVEILKRMIPEETGASE